MKTPMTSRERFQAVMNGQPFDRLPLVEWAVWWDKTIERWHAEGLPHDLTDRYDICRHFGLEAYFQDWLPSHGADFPYPTVHGAPAIPGTMEAYEKLLPFLYPENAINVARWQAWATQQERGEAVLWFTLEGFFWFPRTLLGVEPHMYAFYDQPELMHRINADLADWHVKMIGQICSVCAPDFMTFAEDMSYNNGPMLSQGLFEEFIAPYYRKVIPHLKRHGIIPIVDSDGDIARAVPWFEAAGIEGILPLERQAGVDIVALRQKHPRMKWIGAFDKMVMNKGEAAIRAEFERLLPAARKGHLIISCDHQTPPGVSYPEYQLYLRLFREYAAKAAS